MPLLFLYFVNTYIVIEKLLRNKLAHSLLLAETVMVVGVEGRKIDIWRGTVEAAVVPQAMF